MKLLRELTALTEGDQIPFHFGLQDAGNVKKAMAALRKAALKFQSDENGGITYFYFPDKAALMAAAKVVKAAIDPAKEDEWGSVKESKTNLEDSFTATDIAHNPGEVTVLVMPTYAPESYGVNVIFKRGGGRIQVSTADQAADDAWDNSREEIISVAKKALDAEDLKHLQIKSVDELHEATGDVVELTKFDGKEIPSGAWPRGVKYKGKELFQAVYEEPPVAIVKAEQDMKNSVHSGDRLEFQEVFLGYSPSKDVFIHGYDGWLGDGNCSPYIVFTLDEHGKAKVVQKGYDITRNGFMWYHGAEGGHTVAKRRFPDLIDIRLD